MTEQTPITHNPTLREGDVALVIGADDTLRIEHNVASVVEHNRVSGGTPEGTSFLMALAMIIATNQDGFPGAVREASSQLDSLEFGPTSAAQH